MAEEYMESQEPDRKSKYNAAISQLYRLDELWRECHKQKRNYNLFLWNIALDSIWSELSEDSKIDDDNEFNRHNRILILNEFFIRKQPIGFETVSQVDVQKQAINYQILLSKEVWLRKLQNKQGKGAVYEDSMDTYMD